MPTPSTTYGKLGDWSALTNTPTLPVVPTLGAGLNLTLVAGTQYFIAVSVNAVGTTAGMLCLGPTVAATTGQIAVLPKSWPGNLDIDLGYITSGYAQFAVTAGALPVTAPTIVAQAAWTGGFPLFFLDNNNA